MANYRGCSYYKHVASITPASTKSLVKLETQPAPLLAKTQQALPLPNSLPAPKPAARYSAAVSGNKPLANPKLQVNNAQMIKLLTDLLVDITTSDNPKTILTTIIK